MVPLRRRLYLCDCHDHCLVSDPIASSLWKSVSLSAFTGRSHGVLAEGTSQNGWSGGWLRFLMNRVLICTCIACRSEDQWARRARLLIPWQEPLLTRLSSVVWQDFQLVSDEWMAKGVTVPGLLWYVYIKRFSPVGGIILTLCLRLWPRPFLDGLITESGVSNSFLASTSTHRTFLLLYGWTGRFP